jgi:hypothetical protein
MITHAGQYPSLLHTPLPDCCAFLLSQGEGQPVAEGEARSQKPISKRFLDFAQHSRSTASVPGSALLSSGMHACGGSTSAVRAAAHDDAAAAVQQELSMQHQQEDDSEQPGWISGEEDILGSPAKQAKRAGAR